MLPNELGEYCATALPRQIVLAGRGHGWLTDTTSTETALDEWDRYWGGPMSFVADAYIYLIWLHKL